MTLHLNPDDFEAGEAYGAEADGGSVELALVEVRPIEGSPRSGGGFVLTFRGPPDRLLRQSVFRVTGRNLEADIFMVPVGADEQGALYEAVFN